MSALSQRKRVKRERELDKINTLPYLGGQLITGSQRNILNMSLSRFLVLFGLLNIGSCPSDDYLVSHPCVFVVFFYAWYSRNSLYLLNSRFYVYIVDTGSLG